MDSKFSDAYYNRGLIYKNTGKYNEAVKDFGKYISLKPNDPDGYNQRGNCYQALGKNDLAEKDLAKARQLS